MRVVNKSKARALRRVESVAPSRPRPDLDLLLVDLSRKLRVAVVYGGSKEANGAVIRETDNPRSWKSYRRVADDIAQTLRGMGLAHVAVLADDMTLLRELKRRRINLVWLNTGGVQGRYAMSHTSALLEMCGIPYVGHDPLLAALLDSKGHFKRCLEAQGIAIAPYVICKAEHGRIDVSQSALRGLATRSPYGFVVKPNSGRASLHVHFVERQSALPAVVGDVYEATRSSVIVESFLPGREYCVGIGGPVVSRRGRLEEVDGAFVFSAVERRLDRDEPIFTSMDMRPITTKRIVPLSHTRDGHTVSALHGLALAVRRELQIEALIRLDVREDARGALHVLEANPKPDLLAPRDDAISILCAGLDAEGMTYADLIRSQIADRLARLFDGRTGSVEQFLATFKY